MSQENSILNYFSPKSSSQKKSPIASQKREAAKRDSGSPSGSLTKKKSQSKPEKEKNETEVLIVEKDAPSKETAPTNGEHKNSAGDQCTTFPYEAYDLIWSRLEGYPYWPSIVCPHPQSFDIKKREKNYDLVHVQFFDDPPQRSWIKVNETIKYTGPVHPVHKIIVKRELRNAIEYCEEAFKMDKQARSSLIVELQPSDDEESFESAKSDHAKGDHKVSTPVKVDTNETSTPKSQRSMSKRKASLRSSQKKRRRVIVASDDDDDEDEIGAGDCTIDKDYNPRVESSSSEDEGMEIEEFNESNEEKKVESTQKSKAPEKQTKQQTPSSTESFKSKSDFLKVHETSVIDKTPDSWRHLTFEFLKPENIKDSDGRRPDHPNYNPKTLFVPKHFLKDQTPAHKQWWEMKSKHYDTVLFFKVGKFYELFHMDAVIGYSYLNLLHMKGEIAHAGFPESSYERYSDRLLRNGFKVARVEQTERPEQRDQRIKNVKSSKDDKVVAREICRITTQGTRTCSVLDPSPPDCAKFLLSFSEKELTENRVEFGVCFSDTTTGVIYLGCFNDDKHRSRLRTLFTTHPPAEILVEIGNVTNQTKLVVEKSLPDNLCRKDFQVSTEQFSLQNVLDYLMEKKIFINEKKELELPAALSKMFTVNGLNLSLNPKYETTAKAFGAVVNKLRESLIDEEILTMKLFENFVPSDCETSMQKKLILDSVSLKNLEVFVNSCDETKGTLLETVNFCVTKFGSRLLRNWLCYPLCNVPAINERLDAVEDLIEFQSNCLEFSEVTKILKQMPDLQRSLLQIHSQGSLSRSTTHPDSRAVMFEEEKYSKRKIVEFLNTLSAFRKAHNLLSLFASFHSQMKSSLLRKCTSFEADGGHFPNMLEELKYFDKAFDHEEAKAKGQIIPNSGVDNEYDTATMEIQRVERDSEIYLKEQSKYLGCKITYFGTGRSRFQLEVPDSKTTKVPSSYEYSSSRKGFRRFVTSNTKKFLSELNAAEEKQQNASKDILRKLFAKFDENYEKWVTIVKCLEIVDCLLSLVRCTDSLRQNGASCCRPQFVESSEPFLRIKNGKHPCLLRYCDNFVENDIEVNRKLLLITGPNMGGKSTLMRQTALIVIMAQIGAFVPADECSLTPVDRIFTRLGAFDRILEGESTFYVEMSETSIILNNATDRSLVILDELGRGTSTYDGTAIAYSVINEISHKIKCRTLFSTHYHSLVDDFEGSSYVDFMHMACKVENEDLTDPTNETITFLYKLKPGFCPKSYGFNAAKLAGIQEEIIRNGFVVAQNLEGKHLVKNLLLENLDAKETKRIIKLISKVHV